jgi:DNA-binding CsgD family transcriptional regulator
MNMAHGWPIGELEGLAARSPIAMLLADDARRYVDVNEAACALLKVSREALLASDVDAFTPVALRGHVPALWDRFLSQGSMHGVYELSDGSGGLLRVTYIAIARVLPGRHLSCLLTGRQAGTSGALTARERDVVALAAQGLTSRAIAETLSVSRATVETHFRGAARRLGARNRTHAIALALTRGEIVLPSAVRPGG